MQLWFAFTSLLTFLLTLFALVLAIQLYALLRTGTIGATWRIVSAGVVAFGIGELFRFASVWKFIDPLWAQVVSLITNFLFIILLAWALWIQRQAFHHPQVYRFSRRERERGYPSRFERRSPEEVVSGLEAAEPLDDDDDETVALDE